MARNVTIDSLKTLQAGLRALDVLPDHEFLDTIRLNLVAQIPLCDFFTGRSLEYMTERMERIIVTMKQAAEATASPGPVDPAPAPAVDQPSVVVPPT